MNWLNINTPVLRSPEFIGCDPVARATWLYVMAYACEQENGGVIQGCRQWKDRQWQQTCGVTLEEVESSFPLLWWEGENLIVIAYPKDKEEEVKAKRTGGSNGGKKRAENALQRISDTQSRQDTSTQPSIASSTPSSSASTEEKRIEGKEIKVEGKEPPNPQGGIREVDEPKKEIVSTEAGKAKAPENPQAIRVGLIYGRKPTTAWSPKEIKSFRLIRPLDETDLQIIEEYYTANKDQPNNFCRRDLLTLLNNWQGEVDRARRWKQSPRAMTKGGQFKPMEQKQYKETRLKAS